MNADEAARAGYRGRLAPTPSGYLHLGHALTFEAARERAVEAGGTLILRMEDLDAPRCRSEYVAASIRDLRDFGFVWAEGPDLGGPYGPYAQSERGMFYRDVWQRLQEAGVIYPSAASRKEIAEAGRPSRSGKEILFPPAFRPTEDLTSEAGKPGAVNWRFRVPDGEAITFRDACAGPQRFVAGEDFGDFLVWRKEGFPSYELAVVADDHAMAITEVVRGQDLLLSTARQLLLYRALGWNPPAWYHSPLVRDASGERLSKSAGSLALRQLLEAGKSPAACLAEARLMI